MVMSERDYRQLTADPKRSDSARKGAATRSERQKRRESLIRVILERGMCLSTENMTTIAKEWDYQDLLDNPHWLVGDYHTNQQYRLMELELKPNEAEVLIALSEASICLRQLDIIPSRAKFLAESLEEKGLVIFSRENDCLTLTDKGRDLLQRTK